MKNIDYYFNKSWFYFRLFKLIEINIENPFKTMNKLKGIFVPLLCKFYCGTNIPLFNIHLWNKYGKLLYVGFYDIDWKDKYDTPRYEYSPIIVISIFKYTFCWTWKLYPHLNTDSFDLENYWEQALWYLYYYNNTSYGCDSPDLEKAKESWPWTSNDKSTWQDKFIKMSRYERKN